MSSRSTREGSASVRAPRTPVGSLKKKSSSSGRKSAAAAEPDATAAVHRRSSSGSNKKTKRSASPEDSEEVTSARKSLASQGRSAEQTQTASSAAASRSGSYVDPSLFAPKSRTASSASSAADSSPSDSAGSPPRLSRFSSRSRTGNEDPDEEHPWKRMTREAERGEVQIGFHNDQYIEDISVKFLYKPHTITALLTVVGVLLFLAFRTETHPDNWVENVRVGIAASIFFILVLGLLIFPSGPFIRPHPLVWRLAFGVAVVYEIFLIMLLFQTKEHARMSMKFFDPSLGVKVTERSYAADCSVNWTTVSGAMDVFVLSHFLGWVIKAMLIRDWLICWVVSIQWELIEILFQHWLPNFAECWWDQWILDVGLSNALGIWLGCAIAEYLEMKEYKWGSYKEIPSFVGKAKRMLMQFTPASWTKVEWKSTSSIKRIIGVQFLILCLHVEELNAFFLKHLLWIPPESKLNVVRLGIWAFVGTPCLRQIYTYMTDPNCKRIGHQTFLCSLVIITECIVIAKFGQHDEFTRDMPTNIRNGLIVFMVGYLAILVVLALRTQRTPEMEKSGSGTKLVKTHSQ